MLVSPLWNRCELLLMPSRVILRAPPGKPLKVLNRSLPAGCCAPGVSKENARRSRPASGSELSESTRTVVETVLEVVSTRGGAAVTSTV